MPGILCYSAESCRSIGSTVHFVYFNIDIDSERSATASNHVPTCAELSSAD